MAKIEELLQEDQNVKRRRERIQKQSSILSKLTRQLSIHDNRAAAASSYSNGISAGKYNRNEFVLIKQYLLNRYTYSLCPKKAFVKEVHAF